MAASARYSSASSRARGNDGKLGVDGDDFAAIEAYGAKRWLGELARALKDRCYQVVAVRWVYILKANGKQRPFGIPTIRDRVVQTAAVLLVLTPIFEADLQPEQYAYREGRSGKSTLRCDMATSCSTPVTRT